MAVGGDTGVTREWSASRGFVGREQGSWNEEKRTNSFFFLFNSGGEAAQSPACTWPSTHVVHRSALVWYLSGSHVKFLWLSGVGRREGDENKVTSLHSKLLNKMLSFIAVPFISTLVFNFSTRTHQRGRMGGR